MSAYKENFDKNLERVKSLHSLYIKLKEEDLKDGKDYKLTDILRAEVALLNSSFEEYFRSVLIEWLPIKASDETLKEFPISLKAGKKAEKLFLNDLAHCRGKTIDEIIQESVLETMQLKSFNNEGEIRSWCSKIGITLEKFNGMREIDAAVHRRHKNVHEADTNRSGNSLRLQSISPGNITPWIKAYEGLVNSIDDIITKWKDDPQNRQD